MDFESAVERVIGGLKKQTNMMSPKDRKVLPAEVAVSGRSMWDPGRRLQRRATPTQVWPTLQSYPPHFCCRDNLATSLI